MDLSTNLNGRLRNTTLPKTSVLLPVFEAIVNSIHAIDERMKKQANYSLDDSYINIKVLRAQQLSFDTTRKPEVVGFEITDNGIGFNSDNYKSFSILDSDYKIEQGCKGIGRLVWLKAFQSVTVTSVFKEDGVYFRRRFVFSTNGIGNETCTKIEGEENIKNETTITLSSIKKEYLPYLCKTVDSVGKKIMDHCIWYFLRDGGAPNIRIFDDGDALDLNKDFEYNKSKEIRPDSFTLKGQQFEVSHIKIQADSSFSNKAFYGAANRLVVAENLETQIPGLFGTLTDEEGNKFSYVCFVSSEFLTENVSPQRLGFDIAEKSVGAFAETEISFEDIRHKVKESVSTFLSSYIEENKQSGEKRLHEFVNKKQPRYRSILSRLSDEERVINPTMTDKQLELRLHSKLMEIEAELLSEGHDLLHSDNLSDEEFGERLSSYLTKAGDLKQSDLASYVAKRRVVLDLLEKALRPDANGNYAKEDVIHQLIMPMRKTSDDLLEQDSNLWLIDERLAFHTFLASDKTISSMPITDSSSHREPDLCSLSVYDNPILINNGAKLPLASITIVELKRPMRNDAAMGDQDDPIEQTLFYLDNIRQGKVKTPNGRPIPESAHIPGYCYIICDITPSILKRCNMHQLQHTADHMGFFGYHPNYNAYIEVISFDKLLNAAKERNNVFFQKLGIPT